MKTAVINGLIITVNKDNEIIKNGSIIFEEGTIQYIGENPSDTSSIDQVIDAKGNIIIPGLINTHGHSPMSLLRGYGDDLPLERWLKEKMWPIEGRFKEEDIRLGAQLAIIEMLKTGTTTYSDFYIYMDIIAEVVKESGIRANLSRGIIGSDSKEENKKKLDEATTFAKNWMGKAEGRITTMLSPHSTYTCSTELISDIVETAKEMKIPVQTHAAETKFEVEQLKKRFGVSPVVYLNNLGFFDNQSLIAHAVFVDNEDLMILKDKKVRISHNPGSNLKLGSGIAPVPNMLNNGLIVALGTDGAASNNNLDMFEEVRLASLIQKGFLNNTALIPARTALRMGTINGSEALFISHLTGSLETGKKADFIILNTNQVHFHPLYDAVSHIVYSASGHDVKDVFINGKQVVMNRQVLTLDEERIIHQVEQLVKKWI